MALHTIKETISYNLLKVFLAWFIVLQGKLMEINDPQTLHLF